jgi:3-deoxy-D-manno-octulosonic-acid transferase
LSENQIPAFLISAVLYQNQFSFSPWANFMKTTLASFSHIFTQSDDALEILKEHEVATDYSLGGDTRYDRVKELSELHFQNKDIALFINNQPVVVAGSTWGDDEQKLQALHAVHQNVKLIIAPHEISNKNITELQELFPNSILFSTIQNIKNPEAYSILIIDCIGLLSKLYRYATIAYVGGGFNRAGIHNILEAAAYGKKVIFGPNYSKSNEAKEMIALSLAHSFSSQEELLNSVDELQSDSQKLEEINKLSKEFVEERTGATEKILQLIERDQVL